MLFGHEQHPPHNVSGGDPFCSRHCLVLPHRLRHRIHILPIYNTWIITMHDIVHLCNHNHNHIRIHNHAIIITIHNHNHNHNHNSQSQSQS